MESIYCRKRRKQPREKILVPQFEVISIVSFLIYCTQIGKRNNKRKKKKNTMQNNNNRKICAE